AAKSPYLSRKGREIYDRKGVVCRRSAFGKYPSFADISYTHSGGYNLRQLILIAARVVVRPPGDKQGPTSLSVRIVRNGTAI
ncbi:hypothetical protein, partial [Erythrobacter donghaensis]|uniref:hypothetical protein n=1 Tax=Erythrobacter donghaensis TaxID=267135 RepID=UPI001E57D1BC